MTCRGDCILYSNDVVLEGTALVPLLGIVRIFELDLALLKREFRGIVAVLHCCYFIVNICAVPICGTEVV